jgi:hypothetical protein
LTIPSYSILLCAFHRPTVSSYVPAEIAVPSHLLVEIYGLPR